MQVQFRYPQPYDIDRHHPMTILRLPFHPPSQCCQTPLADSGTTCIALEPGMKVWAVGILKPDGRIDFHNGRTVQEA